MIPYLGDFVEDDVVYIMFNTYTSDDPSASCTITNFANTDVHIHKDDDVAQRNNAAGITVTTDFDTITGSHLIKIDTNDNTVAGFWVTGHDYFVRIEGTTVDGATINSVVGHFSIENRLMRGTNSAALAATALSDATWTDAKAVHLDANVSSRNATTPPTVGEIRTEMEGAGTKLTEVLTDTGTDGVLLAATATSAQLVDDVWDEILTGATHNVGNSAGKRLREMFDAGIYEEETAQGGTANTITLAATASAIDDYYNMMTLTIIDGAGAGQMRTFKDYNGTTKVATACMNWSVNPDNTSKYVIAAHACVGVFDMQSGVYDLINAECDTALADYDPPTNTEMVAAFTEIKGATWAAGTDTLEHIRNKQTDIETDTTEIGAAGAGLTDLGGMSTGMKGEVQTEANDALIAQNLDHLMKIAVDTDWATTVHLDSVFGHIADVGTSATFSRATDALEAIRDRGDAAWSAAAGNPNVLIDTTISGSPSSQTVFVLAAGSDIDDAYKDQAIVLYDASNNDYPSVRKVSAYTGATKTITLDSAPDFTIVAGDGVKTFVTAPGTTAPTVGQIRTEMEGGGYFLDLIKADTNELQTDWVNGGRLDLLLDAIPTTAMRGTDSATLAATWTDARAGYLDNLSAGAVALAAGVDLTSIHGAALTETMNGYLAAGFTKLFDVATPLLVASEVMRGTDGANTTVPDAAGIAAGLHTTTDSKIDTVDSNVDTILLDTAEIGTAGDGLTDLGGMSTGMQAEVNTEVTDCLTVDTIADSYATDGNQPTIAQGILAIQQMLQEKSISGTTLTVKKPDGSTVAMTFTLDSATAPTSITRAT